MTEKLPLSEKEFRAIYAKVPRLTVEVVLKGSKGLFLTQRNIDPCKGRWHIPGGTVQFGELLVEAVRRIAKRELGIEVQKTQQRGYIEYPSHYLNGLDSPVGIVFVVKSYKGEVQPNKEAKKSGWFKKMPQNMHADQDTFLVKHRLITKS